MRQETQYDLESCRNVKIEKIIYDIAKPKIDESFMKYKERVQQKKDNDSFSKKVINIVNKVEN